MADNRVDSHLAFTRREEPWHHPRVSSDHDVASEPGRRDSSLPPALETVLAGAHLLVVEDDADAREFVSAFLEESGATVEAAASVAEAWTRITFEPRERAFDLIISDIGMPEEDGYVLIERLRGLSAPLGDTPAIALTAYARGEDRARALRSGFDAHTPKPVEPGHLIALAARVLAQNPTRRS